MSTGERFGIYVNMRDAAGKRIPDAVRRVTYKAIAATGIRTEGYATEANAEAVRATLPADLQAKCHVSPYINV